MVVAVIAAAGMGSRMGAPEGKQFITLEGESVIHRTCQIFEDCKRVDRYLVLASADQVTKMRDELSDFIDGKKLQAIIPGGGSRRDSVLMGLRYWAHLLKRDMCNGLRVIALVHDGARCLLEASSIDKVIQIIEEQRCGAGLAARQTDTIRILDEHGYVESTPPRSRVAAMQTPQGADLDILLQALEYAVEQKIDLTDDLQALEGIGYPVRLLENSRENIKLTHPEDVDLAMFYLNKRKI